MRLVCESGARRGSWFGIASVFSSLHSTQKHAFLRPLMLPDFRCRQHFRSVGIPEQLCSSKLNINIQESQPPSLLLKLRREFALKLSRNLPARLWRNTTPDSPSIFTPTNASSMKSPSLPPNACATKSQVSPPT